MLPVVCTLASTPVHPFPIIHQGVISPLMLKCVICDESSRFIWFFVKGTWEVKALSFLHKYLVRFFDCWVKLPNQHSNVISKTLYPHPQYLQHRTYKQSKCTSKVEHLQEVAIICFAKQSCKLCTFILGRVQFYKKTVNCALVVVPGFDICLCWGQLI